MRLISTGSVGWWGVMSALLSRHLVRGSDSFLLRLRGRGGAGKERGGGRRGGVAEKRNTDLELAEDWDANKKAS